ncbi:hypothetical protein K1T35_43195 [Pseudonocardia sp. DSM 110487]|uniref:hypothetical protein n=1 Tax=Pseudonocardia sp. DSM 110487 TaxID=2865833 RepID=UPI001C697659|nr:hypothetical protein [Pseudonocardia sp. DSM 110487]QYN35076.1 hypothetical protein K1T35_43195 [Pseudonocardia sp. DSM 110487]
MRRVKGVSVTRRQVLGGTLGVGAVVLAGCGSSSDTSAPVTPGPSEAATDDGPQGLLANELYRRLDVHTEGRDLFLGLGLYNGALVFASVLSLPLVLDELVPQMALAIDGDPQTRAELNPAA